MKKDKSAKHTSTTTT